MEKKEQESKKEEKIKMSGLVKFFLDFARLGIPVKEGKELSDNSFNIVVSSNIYNQVHRRLHHGNN